MTQTYLPRLSLPQTLFIHSRHTGLPWVPQPRHTSFLHRAFGQTVTYTYNDLPFLLCLGISSLFYGYASQFTQLPAYCVPLLHTTHHRCNFTLICVTTGLVTGLVTASLTKMKTSSETICVCSQWEPQWKTDHLEQSRGWINIFWLISE